MTYTLYIFYRPVRLDSFLEGKQTVMADTMAGLLIILKTMTMIEETMKQLTYDYSGIWMCSILSTRHAEDDRRFRNWKALNRTPFLFLQHKVSSSRILKRTSLGFVLISVVKGQGHTEVSDNNA